MVRPTLDYVEGLVERLPLPLKIRLVERLERETWAVRLERIVSRMRERAARHPISDDEIRRICEEVRPERYERERARRR